MAGGYYSIASELNWILHLSHTFNWQIISPFNMLISCSQLSERERLIELRRQNKSGRTQLTDPHLPCHSSLATTQRLGLFWDTRQDSKQLPGTCRSVPLISWCSANKTIQRSLRWRFFIHSSDFDQCWVGGGGIDGGAKNCNWFIQHEYSNMCLFFLTVVDSCILGGYKMGSVST